MSRGDEAHERVVAVDWPVRQPGHERTEREWDENRRAEAAGDITAARLLAQPTAPEMRMWSVLAALQEQYQADYVREFKIKAADGWYCGRERARPRRADEAACWLRRAVAEAVPDDEDPPPSLRQVACRVGRPVSTLRHGCPDLCAQIAARWRAYRHTRRREREERIRRDVRCAVLQIHAQGLYPSTQRVGARLAAPGYLRAGFAAQAWREALQEVGLRA